MIHSVTSHLNLPFVLPFIFHFHPLFLSLPPFTFSLLEQALQLERQNLEAIFNLALLDFRQGLWKQAEDGWELYLTKDGRSGWAQEAKNFLNQIKTLKQQTTNSQV